MEPIDDGEFILYIEETLIPDLQESGLYATASDFIRLVEIIRSEERWLELKDQGFVKL